MHSMCVLDQMALICLIDVERLLLECVTVWNEEIIVIFFTNRKNKWNKIESKSSEKSQADCDLCYSVHAFGLKTKQRPHNKKNGHIKLCGYCCRNDQCRHYFVSFSINCLRLIQTDERRMPSFFKSRTIKLMRMNLNLVFIIFDDIVFNSAHKGPISIDPFESHIFLVQLWMESIV